MWNVLIKKVKDFDQKSESFWPEKWKFLTKEVKVSYQKSESFLPEKGEILTGKVFVQKKWNFLPKNESFFWPEDLS